MDFDQSRYHFLFFIDFNSREIHFVTKRIILVLLRSYGGTAVSLSVDSLNTACSM